MRVYLKNLRKKHNMSQQDVAERAGISRQYYNLIELGERQQDISVKLLSQLAEVFGVPLQELIEAENGR